MIPRFASPRGLNCAAQAARAQSSQLFKLDIINILPNIGVSMRPVHTTPTPLSERSVKKTIESLKDKGEVPMFDVQVGDIIASKPDRRVVTISQNDTVYDAVKTMSTSKVGALVVVDPQNKKPIGIISERDYLNKVVIHGLSSKNTQVKDIMTKDIITTRPNVSASKCMDMITRGRFRHIPVVNEGGSLIGLISIGDLVKHVLDQQKVTIDHLTKYIEGSY